VAGHEQKGNFLPNVDRYTIPFDSVPAYRNKARMVYEFDAADILQSYMYPAMARSYRTAGFQWCTQFAYDPMATAYANTEYQTHYLNLAYTPSKAISLLIASKVFHKVPRLKSYGSFPTDTLFSDFRVSYKNSLSEMNSDEEFYYSNSTDTKPKDVSKLKHIAGVGNSPVVQYEGTGAYFLDKMNDGIWRLEVMPDIVQIRDPFERASPKKEVTRIEWREQKITILLPGTDLEPKSFYISPGVLFLGKNDFTTVKVKLSNDFAAPEPHATDIFLSHAPYMEVSSGKSFIIFARIAGIDTADKISIEIRATPRWRNIPMQKKNAGEYVAEVPADAVTPGVLNYRIIIQKANNEYYVFPGNYKGNPYAWNNPNNDTWQTIVADDKAGLEIFNTNTDRANLIQYNPDWRNNTFRFAPSDKASQLAVKITAKNLTDKQMMGLQFYFGDKLKGRQTELSSFTKLVLRVHAENPVKARLALITKDALCFSGDFNAGNEWAEIRIPLTRMQPDSFLLLPRPYPGFLPLWFKSNTIGQLNIAETEKFQVICYGEGKPVDIDIAAIWLEK
jgi:hypothetical protein